MKYILIVAILVSFFSCRKNYDCIYEYEVEGEVNTSEIECLDCNKHDIEEFEEYGYTCVAR